MFLHLAVNVEHTCFQVSGVFHEGHASKSCLYLQEEESSDSNKFYPHLMKPMSNRER